MNKLLIALVFSLASLALHAQTFTLKSQEVGGQATINQVFDGFGCTGKNTSPQLNWENAPKGTQSFAITMYDPDAPTGSGWWHWLAFDIPKDVHEIKSGAGTTNDIPMPAGSIQSPNDYGQKSYGGPCPPEGDGLHRYIITIYALKTEKLGLDENTNAAIVGYYLNSNTIQKASIIMYYQR